LALFALSNQILFGALLMGYFAYTNYQRYQMITNWRR